eukprot:SAG25_NODE_5637_length_636_cov_0.763501_1_plen_60_part_10
MSVDRFGAGRQWLCEAFCCHTFDRVVLQLASNHAVVNPTRGMVSTSATKFNAVACLVTLA